MSSIGSAAGILGSAAGAPLSQSAGATTERAQKESAVVQRLLDFEQKAEQASGIGQTEEDSETDQRDADGRRLWEKPTRREGPPPDDASASPRGKDPTGESGTALDLVG